MERLTYRPKEPYISKSSGDLIEACSDYNIREIINRLAAYEDTGLSPQACENAAKAGAALSSVGWTVDRAAELLKADREGRVVVYGTREEAEEALRRSENG